MSNLAKTAVLSVALGAISLGHAQAAGEVRYQQGAYQSQRVEFQSQGTKVVGLLLTPDQSSSKAAQAKRPAVVILGPFASIKEQAPLEYATRLVRDGFVTLIFDPRYSGESGGEPRRLESPSAKIQDVQAALGFLEKQPRVDAARLAAIGVCQGASIMLAVSSQDKRVKALANISGQYIYPKNIDGFFSGGGLDRLERIERGEAAKAQFKSTGDVAYTKIVDPTDKNVGLPWKPIHDWYNPWTTEKWLKPSRWENRYATMSDAEVWSFNVDNYSPKVKVPTLIVHGEMSDGNKESAEHVYKSLGASDKKLTIVPGVFHTRFYDDPLVIDPAAAQVSQWLAKKLK